MITQVNDKETEFPFVSSKDPEAIIVVMGLPFTRTKEVAGVIGRWARCPVLNKDHFLDSISWEAGYGEESLPSRDEAERLHRLAFDTLCSVTCGFLESKFSGFKCVVIKSPRICSTYELIELKRLLALADYRSYNRRRRIPLILVECRFGNEYLWKQNFPREESRGKWYEARDWKEIDKDKEDYNAQAFDLLLLQLISSSRRVRRLVVDPCYDLSVRYFYNVNIRNYLISWMDRITPSLASAIKFLLTAGEQELNKEIPQTVELRQLRRYLMEKKIAAASASRERSNYLCVGGACLFKYWETLTEDSCSSCTCSSSSCCGVCEEPLVVVGEAAYSCYFCVLALHKSCAEMPHFSPPSSSLNALWSPFMHLIDRSPKKHPCKSCTEAGQVFTSHDCASCWFQTHLKSRLIPTIILNPDFHDHMISLQFLSDFLACKGCGSGMEGLDSGYGCSICETYYHPYCPFWPKEFKHKHGGHDHLMKLLLSHHGAEEEGYWCDICYDDIDPQVWFYSCQHCPYYVAHLNCTLG